MYKEKYYKETLDNGITVVMEEIPYLRSVSIGIWIKAGSLCENKINNGISHFLEHLAFKGTEKRTAYDIALEIDTIGGQIDAYTTRESTTYSAKILDEQTYAAIDILSDILINSKFDKDELEKERKVVMEEIKMVDDSPTDYLFDLFYKNVWGDHPIGQPIQGTAKTVNEITREKILNYRDSKYFPQNIVISVAGNIKKKELLKLLNSAFGKLNLKKNVFIKNSPTFCSNIKIKQKELEQAHFFLGLQGIKSNDVDRYKGYLLNIILGGSMSSRLFQKIREEMGLAYSIYSFNNSYQETGLFGLYAGTSPEKLTLTVELILKEIRELVKVKISVNELNKAKKQLKGNILISLESSLSRMSQLARQELYFDRYISIDEINSEIEKITIEDIQKMAENIFKGKTFAITVLGNLKGNEISEDMLRV